MLFQQKRAEEKKRAIQLRRQAALNAKAKLKPKKKKAKKQPEKPKPKPSPKEEDALDDVRFLSSSTSLCQFPNNLKKSSNILIGTSG